MKNHNNSIYREAVRVISEEISHIKDVDALLDKVLFESRKITNADAGTIFLNNNGYLTFKHIQNDTLFSKNDLTKNKYLYSNNKIAVDNTSIAGYVANTKTPLLIEDTYSLPIDVPYNFNSTFDQNSHYQTKSILSHPLVTSQNKVLGVIQLINAKDSHGKISTFTNEHRLLVDIFANEATLALERALMTRTMILRMILMAGLRDPKETKAHVMRVASYSVEIYHKWALLKGICEDEIQKFKDDFRLAAMLHDVGKVAISDSILKKPGPLTDSEYTTMKFHSIAGESLFNDSASDLDKLSEEVAINHHEKWDGTGYPGNFKRNKDNEIEYGIGKKGEDIPISGRIVAIADVYDALISKRCYKDAWPEEKVLAIIKKESGKHFDPEVVDAFLAVYDIIKAIRIKYQET